MNKPKDILLTELQRKDEKATIRFAIKGMHFDWYMDSKLALNLYGKYFWHLETSRATQCIAAYAGDKFVGVILAEFKNEKPLRRSIWRRMYVAFFEFIQKTFLKDSVGIYDEVNRQMFQNYLQTNTPDGEIIFLAANPDCGIKGVGTMLLSELEKRERGKRFTFTRTTPALTNSTSIAGLSVSARKISHSTWERNPCR